MESHPLTADPLTSLPLPHLSRVQWGQRGGITCPSVGSAHMGSWADTRSLSSSISTASCSSQMTGQSSLVSATPGPLSREGLGGSEGNTESAVKLTVRGQASALAKGDEVLGRPSWAQVDTVCP